MGIKDLSKFLRNRCPNIFHEVHLSQFRYKKAAVDISVYIFKYYSIFGPDKWIQAFFNLIACLRRNDIHACFIYDTKAPEEKADERRARRERREKLDKRIEELVIALEKAKSTNEIDPILKALMEKKNFNCETQRQRLLQRPCVEQQQTPATIEEIELQVERIKNQACKVTQADFDLTKECFTLLGVPHFQAPNEAETTCADLCKQGEVDIVVSEDTDVLAYGAPILLTKINTSFDTCVYIAYGEMLEAISLSSASFLDFCIMCGTDYNKNISKIGPETAYKLILKSKSIEQIACEGVDVDVLNYVRVRQLFTEYEKVAMKIPYCTPPLDFSNVAVFMRRHNIFYSLEKLKRELSEPQLEFME